jgi:hypothetical protein
MKLASVSYKPQLDVLENRCQPGSMLSASLCNPLLLGSLVNLDIQDQPQATLPALVSEQPVADASPGSVLAPPDQTVASEILASALQAIQGAHVAQFPVLELQALNTVQSQELANVNLGKAGALMSAGKSGIGIQGGGCEFAGNVVVNGDFETGSLDPWSTSDGYTGVAGPGAPLGDHGAGDLTPTFHLVLGNVGSPGSVNQTLSTVPGQDYNIIFSARVDSGGPQSFAVLWNGAVVDDISFYLPSDTWTREVVSSPVTGTGSDFLELSAQHDPAWWHADDVCVTPVT